jgi:hypothetical protein
MNRTSVSRVSFWIALLFLTALVIGIIVEVTMRHLLFENYVGTFFTWAFIFGVINALTRVRRK